MTYPAIFLDRDGVIIHNRANYVRAWEDVRIYPNVLRALARMRDSRYKLVIVSNQAGIAKGLISSAVAEEINRRILARIEAQGGRIDAVFICPHRSEDECECRKPHPGLLLNAAQALSLDLSRSIMIGDALTDIEAGQRAGVGLSILVQTGRGRRQLRQPLNDRLQPFLVKRSADDAIRYILKNYCLS